MTRDLRIGGVMRCCVETLDTYEGTEAPGTVLPCRWCKSSLIVAPDGVWQWNRPAPDKAAEQVRVGGL